LRRIFRSLVLLAISAGALWLSLRQVAWADVAEALARVSPWSLLMALLCLAVAMWAKVERWRWLLDPNRHLSRLSLALALLIGYLGNVILPARLGELVRAYVASELAGVDTATGLSSIVLEKMLDIGYLLLILLVLLLTVPLAPWAQSAGRVGGAVFLGMIVFVADATLFGKQALALLSQVQNASPRWLAQGPWWEWVRSFVIGLAVLRSPARAAHVVLWTAVTWISGMAVNLFVLSAFGIGPLLPASALTLVTTNLGMALPSVPGYIGVHHYLSMLALMPFAIDRGLAFSYALVIHALIFGSFALAGLIALWWAGLNLTKLKGRAKSTLTP